MGSIRRLIVLGLVGVTMMFTGCTTSVLEAVVNSKKTMVIGEVLTVSVYNNSKEILETEGNRVFISDVRSETSSMSNGKVEYSQKDTSTIEIDVDGNRLFDEGNTVIIMDNKIESKDIQELKEKGTGSKLIIYDRRGEKLKEIVGENISIDREYNFDSLTHLTIDGYSCYLNNANYLLVDLGIKNKAES